MNYGRRRTANLPCDISIADVSASTSSPAPNGACPQPSFEQHPCPGNPRKIHVALPEEPPDVTECVAVALLHLLRALTADPSRPCPEADEGQEAWTSEAF